MSRPEQRHLFDELAHAGPEHLDPAYVAGYDRKAQVDVGGDLALLAERGLDKTSTLVDLGAGTGTFALAAARLCRRVVAVDVSRAMLEALRTKLAASSLENVEVVHAGFLSYDRPANTVDLVYSRNALHHLPDFWKGIALQRIANMLRSGGTFRLRDLVYSFSADRADAVFAAWLAQAPADRARGFTREDLETHIRTEFSTFSWLLEAMLERVGFAIEDVTHSPSQVFSAYVCRKR
jgi:ubiquinone/menaquinone biosynthesis C-methylase UbiE